MKSSKRTDLAIESVTQQVISKGITRTLRGKHFRITEIKIDDDECGKQIGKPKGRYVTLESSSLDGLSGDYRGMIEELADELKRFIPQGHIMVAGLGNNDITPDALGVYAAEGIIATRHLKDNEFLEGLRPVSVLVSGVVGKTGIETAETIKSIAEKIKPQAIIAIDALACSDISRLGTTIQISDTGICPGSGVQNKRKEISYNTMNIPVIAVGVPTVIDMHTMLENFTGKKPESEIPNMMITPKNIDRLTKHCASLISAGINSVLQPELSHEDIEEMQR